MEIKITLPLTKDKVKALKAGDCCLLSGVMYTGRDAAHKRLFEMDGVELEFTEDALREVARISSSLKTGARISGSGTEISQ